MSWLTDEERKVVIFLLLVALLGGCANYLFKKISPSRKNISSINENIGKVDLNTATREALLDIPHIGLTVAQRILEYRDKNGAFQDTEELKKVKGVTNYRFGKIKDYIYVK
ncbi:MAG: helix-hairpin-helix domain-containing protein [Candidatus Omnitrophota bacterium]